MALFAWKDEYSVGVDELDSHHKTLFGIVNSLYECCLETDGDNFLGPKLEELWSYSSCHFSAEERYMKEKGFRDLDPHLLQHKAFIHRLAGLKGADFDNDHEKAKELIVFLGNWLLNHVIKEDRKYSASPPGGS